MECYISPDLQKTLDIIDRIEGKKEVKQITQQKTSIEYIKPAKLITKKQRSLFDYIFDNWIYNKQKQYKAIKKIISNYDIQLCLF